MTRCMILILLALVLAACGSPTTSQVVETLVTQPTTEVVTPNTATLVAQPTPEVVPTPTATVVATLVAQPTPEVVPTPTATVLATLVAQPTPQVVPTNTATRTRSQDGMLMVYVPAGDFTMGSLPGEGSDEEFPQHKVTLDGFWIDRTEVTNAQYRAFVGATGHPEPTSCDWGEPTYGDEAKVDHPVVCVSWADARAYCEWAGARLPTEAEWEKAAGGTDGRAYPWGASFDGTRLNHCDVNCEFVYQVDSSDASGQAGKDPTTDDGYARTAPVGTYPTGASPYGALDMAGNVWEWVNDWYYFYYYGKSPELNPQGPNTGQYRVLRGGSWLGSASNARTGFRAWSPPEERNIVSGFRCVDPSTPAP